LGRIDYKR